MQSRNITENLHFDPSEAACLAIAADMGLNIPAEAIAGIAQNWALLAQHHRHVSDALKAEDGA